MQHAQMQHAQQHAPNDPQGLQDQLQVAGRKPSTSGSRSRQAP
jgi:hypothetical protein